MAEGTALRRTRVLLVEDHQMLREGLRALLEAEADIEIVSEAEDGRSAVVEAQHRCPDVVVMDISLPELDGVEATRRILRELPDAHVVILSMHDDDASIDRALRAGARGYVLKGSGVATLCAAIRTVQRGEVYLSPAISRYVLQGYLEGNAQVEDPLSEREREVLALIAEGFTGRQIAVKLGLKPKTVDNHRTRLMDKLDIHTTAGLVRHAIRVGLVKG